MTRNHSPAIAWMIDGWDGGDPWGSAMEMAWAVAEVSWALGEYGPVAVLGVTWGAHVPNVADIREAMREGSDYTGDVSYDMQALLGGWDAGEVTLDHMTFAARVLTRYLDLCKRAGLDY